MEQKQKQVVMKAIRKARGTIIIKSAKDIKVVDYDDVARPHGRYPTDRDQKKDS